MMATREKKHKSKLLLLAILLMVVLNFPLLSIANQPKLIVGIPMLYWYVFLWWGSIVALAGIVVHHKYKS